MVRLVRFELTITDTSSQRLFRFAYRRIWYPRGESNARLFLRRKSYYPLYDEGNLVLPVGTAPTTPEFSVRCSTI